MSEIGESPESKDLPEEVGEPVSEGENKPLTWTQKDILNRAKERLGWRKVNKQVDFSELPEASEGIPATYTESPKVAQEAAQRQWETKSVAGAVSEQSTKAPTPADKPKRPRANMPIRQGSGKDYGGKSFR